MAHRSRPSEQTGGMLSEVEPCIDYVNCYTEQAEAYLTGPDPDKTSYCHGRD
jgi:hypothetical protein